LVASRAEVYSVQAVPYGGAAMWVDLREMTSLLAICLLLQAPQTATTVVAPGGTSPDGRYEVRIVKTLDSPSDYRYELVEIATKRSIKTLGPMGGYYDYAFQSKNALVRWHASSRFFAVTDRGTSHSQELYVFEVTERDVVRLTLPDYQQNALGRVDAVATNLTSVTEPLAWNGDMLTCRLTFDITSPAAGRAAYTVGFALRLWHGPASATWISLGSMGRPRSS
jgi:hypothetical protein